MYIGSGRVLVIGGKTLLRRFLTYYLQIAASNNPNFLEELMVMNAVNECHRLGAMTQHLVVTPDMDSLLNLVEKGIVPR